MRERLQKIMAGCGVASRRKAEEMIAAGRVTVNGTVVRELGTKADLEVYEILVDGKRIERAKKPVYWMLNKPKGYVTTVNDPEGRPTVMDLLGKVTERARVYPVGRLDYGSEGLLLLTNDGELAAKLMKAGSHVEKTYLVKVSGKPEQEKIARLRAGVVIELDDGRKVKTAPARIRLADDGLNPWYEVTLIEGRNRQIRRMFEKVGHHVEKIRRVRMGPLRLDVEVGKCRELKAGEIEALKKAAEKGNK
jgi:23S rRNA pseudouridine2605 synthase